MFSIAHANDGGGSIRIPASCCGLVGLKPARGRVPSRCSRLAGDGDRRRGLQDRRRHRRGPRLRSPAPIRWRGSNAPAPDVPFSQRSGTTLARCGSRCSAPRRSVCLSSASRGNALEKAGTLLEKLGHKVFTIDNDVFATRRDRSRSSNVVNTGFGDYDGIDWSRTRAAHPGSAYDAGQADRQPDSRACLAELQRHSRKIVARWGDEFDLLVTPTMTIEPPVAGAVLAEVHANPDAPSLTVVAMAAFTAVYNITGQPAMSLPLHWSADGLPIGVQIVGGPWQEALLIQVASQLEEAAPWAGRHAATVSSS